MTYSVALKLTAHLAFDSISSPRPLGLILLPPPPSHQLCCAPSPSPSPSRFHSVPNAPTPRTGLSPPFVPARRFVVFKFSATITGIFWSAHRWEVITPLGGNGKRAYDTAFKTLLPGAFFFFCNAFFFSPFFLQRRSLAPSQLAKRKPGGNGSEDDEDWCPEAVSASLSKLLTGISDHSVE